ncbi:MAG: cupin domain-containing protein [Holdemania filiformis]
MLKLTDKQALEFGIQPVHHQMDNGELRFRLTRDTGSSYILTLSAEQSGWQSSHVHLRKREFYIVEQGWIVLALRQSEQLTFRRLGPNDSFMLPPGLPHNVYLSEGSVLHTVKYGSADADWEAAPELDEKLRHETLTAKRFSP